jgi:uncharacterized protein involved in response to NO
MSSVATPGHWGSWRALFSSGFRPFFLLGACYGPLSLALNLAAHAGRWPLGDAVLLLGHAHELIYGFASATVCGVLLTALPSWTGAAEVRGAPLAALVALWLAGRVAWWLGAWLPQSLALMLDCTFFPMLLLMLLPTLRGARKRLFLWSTPPLLGLAAGNLLVHLALLPGDVVQARFGIALGLHSLLFMFSLYAGLLTPTFTRGWLRERGEHSNAILLPLEYATALAMLLFSAADLTHAGAGWMEAACALAVTLHCWRFARWRGWRTTSEPLLWTLHLGYAFLIAAIALRGACALFPTLRPDAWIHLFTLGALGMCKVGLMTRVVLRHTGRPMRVPSLMKLAYAMMLAAALLRLAFTMYHLNEVVLALSAMLWSLAFVLYLACFAPALLRPSLPRAHAVAQ